MGPQAPFQRRRLDKICALCASPQLLPVFDYETVSTSDFHFLFFICRTFR